jgi:hypothetical protein
LTEVDDANVTLTLGGSPSTALLANTSLTLGWTGILPVNRGGTGSSTQNFVDLTTAQTIAGAKTFSSAVTGGTPTLSTHLTTKAYIDATYIAISQEGVSGGVATLDNTGKVPAAQLPTGALVYKGTWNASTNTPAISDATGSNGYLYIVSAAGTQNLGSGSLSFTVGESVIHNGSYYQIAPSSNDVITVNGQQGTVVLTSSNIAEGTNLYYTDARAIAAPLTGYAVGTNTPLSSGNSVLTALENLQGQINSDEPAITNPNDVTKYYRGDKTFQTLNSTAVGLGNVTNTSDADKPVSTAQQTALNLKANLASPTFTGTPTLPSGTIAVTQAPGDNTTDVATTAFVTGAVSTGNSLKANIASPTFTGSVTLPTGSTSAAPLLFVQGNSLTTPVSGALEYDGSSLYYTNNTPARNTIANLEFPETFTGTKTFTTPVLGVATATTINKVTLTTPTSGSTLTIADGKTLTANNSVTLSGTDGSTLNIGTGGALGSNAFSSTLMHHWHHRHSLELLYYLQALLLLHNRLAIIPQR